MILRHFISLRAFTVYMENSLLFEICTEVSFTSPELMWTLIMKLPYTEVKFYPEVKSQTVLRLIRVSCTSALHQTRKIDSWIIHNICKTSTTRKCYSPYPNSRCVFLKCLTSVGRRNFLSLSQLKPCSPTHALQ